MWGGLTLSEYIKSLIGYFPIWLQKRAELGIPLDAFVLVSVGELNANKNNSMIIKALERLNAPNIHYILCGVGKQEKTLKMQANKVNLQNNVHFLGYRNDIREIYAMSDCFVLTSYREGLSRSLMEAMASGLPCIVSRIRGNVDLIDDGKGGFLCGVSECDDYVHAIRCLYVEKNIRKRIGEHNRNEIIKFDVENVKKEMKTIYRKVLYGGEA